VIVVNHQVIKVCFYSIKFNNLIIIKTFLEDDIISEKRGNADIKNIEFKISNYNMNFFIYSLKFFYLYIL